MKVLVDMNLSPRWIDILRGFGHDPHHWSNLGHAAASDDELIEWARENGAIVLTNDLDFGVTLVTRGLTRPSVVQLRSDDLRPSTLGVAVARALETYSRELASGVLLTIDLARTRIRLLELGP